MRHNSATQNCKTLHNLVLALETELEKDGCGGGCFWLIENVLEEFKDID